jgi:nicotinamidase-related amidase
MKKTAREKAVLLMVDMQKAFVEPEAALCIDGAKATVPACARAVREARELGVRLIWIRRNYREDFSDMEIPRREMLMARGIRGVLAPGSTGVNSEQEPDGLVRLPDDEMIIKPRFSAFFRTDLDDRLSAAEIDTVLIAGTTTPNCIRTTCFDAISLDYNVIVLEPCCSSMTNEIQDMNMADMERAGAAVFRGASLKDIIL